MIKPERAHLDGPEHGHPEVLEQKRDESEEVADHRIAG